MIKVDAHQHFWNLTEVVYPWLTPTFGPIYKTFEPRDLKPRLKAAGVDLTVVVQAANSYEDTASMLIHADTHDWIGGVVGWVNLLDPDETNARLEMYTRHRKFKGIRHLIHDEPDPDWVVQDVVIESLKIVAGYGLPFDVVGVFPNHIKHVPTLAARVPGLRMILDHLCKPPIKDRMMSPWTDQMRTAAESPDVYAKISGLNTAADWEHWRAADLKPYIDFAFDTFGADRLIFGSDWPVCNLAGDYEKVWTETNSALSGRSPMEIEAVMGGTAQSVYQL